MRLSDRVGRSRECLKNRSRDPIENSAESNESRKRGRKFLVSSGDAALAFESSEEVLYMVTLPIVAAVKRPVFLACGIDGQARKDILFHQQHPPGIGVVTFVGDQSSALASRQTIAMSATFPALSSNLSARPCPSTNAWILGVGEQRNIMPSSALCSKSGVR